MNAKPPSHDVKFWLNPPDTPATPVPGYEAWLKAELEAGVADVEAGRVVGLDQVRREFGLE